MEKVLEFVDFVFWFVGRVFGGWMDGWMEFRLDNCELGFDLEFFFWERER